MVRTQIQLTEEQSQALKRAAASEGKPVAELIRRSIDVMLRSKSVISEDEKRQRAIAAAGKFSSEDVDLSTEHDRYLSEAYEA
jgi:hypothetical protein